MKHHMSFIPNITNTRNAETTLQIRSYSSNITNTVKKRKIIKHGYYAIHAPSDHDPSDLAPDHDPFHRQFRNQELLESGWKDLDDPLLHDPPIPWLFLLCLG